MSVGERDPHTGHMTTGHEWNGIKELNTPVPKPVWIFLVVFFLFSLVYWVLMPAWPLGVTFTRGLLGIDQGRVTMAKVERGARQRAAWTQRIEAGDYAAILADPALMTRVRQDGHRLFGDNCSACHGIDARGGPGFPNLVDRDWLWGGAPETIAETVRVGVNAPETGTRVSQMLAFGRSGLLDDAAIRRVSLHVLSLSDPALARRANPRALAAGRSVFAAQCASCHGADGRGDAARGIPNLADQVWIHGGDFRSVYNSIDQGRQGQMPAWGQRLSPADIRILTLYLLDRGRQRP